MTRRIVVLGGTGFVGHALCERLVRERPGWRITVPTRRPRFGLPLQSLPGVEVITADVHQPDTLRKLLLRADAAVNLIAILHGSTADFQRAHVELPARLARACADVGIGRLVHVSAIGASTDGPSRYLRSKGAGEEALRTASPLAPVILRPSVIFGAGDRFLNLFARLQRVAPFFPLAGSDAKMQPVWVEDVARALVCSLDDPALAGRTLECCGPTLYTLGDLVRLAGRLSGHPRPVLPLPMAAGRLQATLLRLLPGEPLLSQDNLDSLQVPNVASGTLPGLADLGIEAASVEAVAPSYLSAGQGDARFDRWRSQR